MSLLNSRALTVDVGDRVSPAIQSFPTGSDKEDHVKGFGLPVYRDDIGSTLTKWYWLPSANYWVYEDEYDIHFYLNNPRPGRGFIGPPFGGNGDDDDDDDDDDGDAAFLYAPPVFIPNVHTLLLGSYLYVNPRNSGGYRTNWRMEVRYLTENSLQVGSTLAYFPTHKRGSNGFPYAQTPVDYLNDLGVNRRFRIALFRRSGTRITRVRDLVIHQRFSIGFPAT